MIKVTHFLRLHSCRSRFSYALPNTRTNLRVFDETKVVHVSALEGPSPGVVMKISNCVVGSIVVTTTVAGANAAFLGITGTNYQVIDGSRQFSVMDIYADFDGANDKLVH